MAATASFMVSSITPKTLAKTLTLTPFFSLPTSQLNAAVCFPLAKRFESLSSRFVSNVAVSEYGQEEEVAERPPQFSPDLKIFVGNLPFNVESSDLAGLFGEAGTVEMVEVIYDKMTGRSRGFAFVTMSTVEEAEAAARQYDGYELDGRQLRVNAGPAPPKDSAPRLPRSGGGQSYGNNNRVHVGNLSWKVDDAALMDLFSDAGAVVEAKVIYDRDSGRSRGFGFVTYNSAEEVNKAIESLDGLDFNGRNIRLSQAEARQRRSF